MAHLLLKGLLQLWGPTVGPRTNSVDVRDGRGAERRREGGRWSEEEEGGEGRRGSLLCSLSDFLSVLCALKTAAAGKCSQSQRDVGKKTGRQSL